MHEMHCHHLLQIEKPLQRHGGRLEHNETYCGSCYGAEAVCLLFLSLCDYTETSLVLYVSQLYFLLQNFLFF